MHNQHKVPIVQRSRFIYQITSQAVPNVKLGKQIIVSILEWINMIENQINLCIDTYQIAIIFKNLFIIRIHLFILRQDADLWNLFRFIIHEIAMQKWLFYKCKVLKNLH